MSNKNFVGDFSIIPKENMSSKLKEELNLETMNILNDCLNKVTDCLTKEWSIVDDLAQELLKKEELDYKEVEQIFAKYSKNKSSDTLEQQTVEGNTKINDND